MFTEVSIFFGSLFAPLLKCMFSPIDDLVLFDDLEVFQDDHRAIEDEVTFHRLS